MIQRIGVKLVQCGAAATAIAVSIGLFSLAVNADDSKGKANGATNLRRAARGKTNVLEQQEQGKALLKAYGCYDCHKINGKGCPDGIDLSDVGSRRTAQFLHDQIKDPDSHVQKNKRAFNFNTSVMADADLSQKEIATIVVYLRTLKSRHKATNGQ
jgi:cytochrome c2